MTVVFLICFGISFLFSLLLAVQNFHTFAFAGAAAGLCFSGVLVYAHILLKQKKSYRALALFRKLFEYWPFAMIACFICSRAFVDNSPKVLDAVLAVLWFAIVILKQISAHYTKDRNLQKYFPQVQRIARKKKSLLIECLEWVDAAFYAVFFVLLVNIFVFQVYRIPSESMVPEFMIGDTVIGFKTAAGPALPLSSFKLPQWKEYKRGDIVILSNPNYPDTPQSRLKTFLSQLVYMLTLAQVNLNTDEYGRQKADPLVKRIAGMPGEKLMMVDGVLYARRAGESGFVPVEDDRQYAYWDLTALPQSDQRLIKDIKINAEELRIMETVEMRRKALDFTAASRQAESLVNRLSLLKNDQDTAPAGELVAPADYELIALFSANDSVSRKILTTNGGLAWFRAFMTGWIPYWQSSGAQQASLYEKRFAQLNALVKICFGKLIVRNIELFQTQATAEQFLNDEVRKTLLQEAQEYAFYLAWTNQRNMNVYPSGADEYIPENCYFMMGDNRFNSTDMRHRYVFKPEAVDVHDSAPVLFQSNSEPKYLPAEKILGTTVLRVYPFSRFGAL
ncbi:MAG: signal peptidase I [Treponema sp.]